MPIRHGLTLGELARLFNGEQKIGADLTVVAMKNWRRDDWFDDTGLAWVNPSPNMRNLVAATLYPGIGAIEGTNISVGRGTDTPFEQIGAPWIDGARARGGAERARAARHPLLSGHASRRRPARSSPARSATACSSSSPIAIGCGRCASGSRSRRRYRGSTARSSRSRTRRRCSDRKRRCTHPGRRGSGRDRGVMGGGRSGVAAHAREVPAVPEHAVAARRRHGVLGRVIRLPARVVLLRGSIERLFDAYPDDQVFVDAVAPGSRAAAAGLQPGDRLVSGVGLPLSNAYTLRVVNDNIPVDAPATWQVMHDGRLISATTAAPGRAMFNPGAIALVSVAFAVSLILGLVVMWRRSNDPTSMLAGWFLAAIGCAPSPYMPRSFAATWRGLPAPFGILLWPGCFTGFAAALLLFTLFCRIRRPALSWRVIAAALAPGAALLGYRTLWLVLDVYAPGLAIASPWPAWLRLMLSATIVVYVAASLAIAADSLRRAASITERRRIRILVGGLFVGLFGVALNTIASAALTPSTSAAAVTGSLAFCAVPISFAYAMLRHRLFDFRVIVRLGLQYAIARGALLAAVPASIVVMLADVAMHNSEPVRQIAADRGWVYLMLTVAALVGHAQRQRWLGALDRRFFRERHAAQQVLHRIVTDLATAPGLDAVRDHILKQIDVALHPRDAAFMFRSASGGRFESLASLRGSDVPPLPARSALAAIVRATQNALVVDTERGGIRPSLPRDDLEWLRASGVELLVPVRIGGSGARFSSRSARRGSEEPYSTEDIELLATIAASLAMVDRADTNAYLSTRTAAPTASAPLSGRYRLGRLLGHGGMGTVWEAQDDVLNRPVAIKFLRAADGSEQLERFQREARLAAGLNHPNVVVVHDFGSDDAGQPFLVMERLPGETLRRRLQRDGRLPPDSAVAVAGGVAAGVGAAHRVLLVHRDLKPENIFLCDAPSGPAVKILDFGLARSVEGETITAFAGTPRYMAPEQAEGGRPTPMWDVWALAAIAYEMLAGAHPLSSAGAPGSAQSGTRRAHPAAANASAHRAALLGIVLPTRARHGSGSAAAECGSIRERICGGDCRNDTNRAGVKVPAAAHAREVSAVTERGRPLVQAAPVFSETPLGQPDEEIHVAGDSHQIGCEARRRCRDGNRQHTDAREREVAVDLNARVDDFDRREAEIDAVDVGVPIIVASIPNTAATPAP